MLSYCVILNIIFLAHLACWKRFQILGKLYFTVALTINLRLNTKFASCQTISITIT
ncbi:hypothetical protein NIES2098_57680 [Calothrix sp. NIES-2098]|nr:hypothetical protein NIES2098_57680 [Calothrix sp. NIES-2098]